MEDLSPEQEQIADVATKFAEEKISPQVHEIEAKNWDVSRKLMGDLGALGLLGIDVPEQYGGLDMDKITSTLAVTEPQRFGEFLGHVQCPCDHRDFTPRVVSIPSRNRNIFPSWRAGNGSRRTPCQNPPPARTQ